MSRIHCVIISVGLLNIVSMAYAQNAIPEGCRIEEKVCQICAVDKDGKPVCSSVGIACAPSELVCERSNKGKTEDVNRTERGGAETIILKTE
jgi:hypothetical protein